MKRLLSTLLLLLALCLCSDPRQEPPQVIYTDATVLPLYDALDSLQIGVPEGYLIREPALPSPAPWTWRWPD